MKWFSPIGDILHRKPSASTSQPTLDLLGVFFLEPIYNTGSITGPSSLKRDTVVSISGRTLIFLLLLSMCILPVPLSFAGQVLTDRDLEQRGINTRATVTKCTRTPSRRPSVVYTYSVTDSAGTVQQLTDEALGNYFQRCVEPGMVIQIQYLGENPSVTRIIEPGLAAVGTDVVNFILTGLPVAVLLLLLVVNLVKYVHNTWRYRKFTTEGVLCSGYILKAEPRTRYGERKLYVEYEFLTPDQRTLRGTQSRVRLDLHAEKLAVPGIPVRVIYVHDRLYWLL